MDINTLGIGAIISATTVASTNLYIFTANHKKDEIKERLDKLYTPMYVYHMENMQYGIDKPYKDYLALKKIIDLKLSKFISVKFTYKDVIFKLLKIIV